MNILHNLRLVGKRLYARSQDFAFLFFPNYCESCGVALLQSETLFCISCQSLFPRTNYHLMNHNPIKDRLEGIIELEHTLAFLKYEKKGKAKRMLHALKYKSKPEIGYHLAYFYGSELTERHTYDFDLILPIPLHRSKMAIRGYNQSDTIAQGFSESMNVPWSSTTISREIANPTQTKKNRLERWKNVEGIFKVNRPEEITGKHVLLVDDVITSGATVEACGRALYASGVGKLSIACIATGS